MSRIRPWLLCLALALAITGFQLATLRPQIGWNGDDYTAYIHNGWAIAHGAPYAMRGYVINPNMDIGIGAYPPAYPALLALPIALFGQDYAVLDAFTVALFGAAVFAMMLYALPLTGTAGALLAGAAAGLGPFVYFWKDSVMSEFCFVLLLFLALLAERRFADRSTLPRTAVLTVAMAAAVLTRAVGAALWPALLLADLLRRRRLRRVVLACLAASVALVALGMLAVNADSFAQYLRLFQVNTMLQTQAPAGKAPPMGLAHGPVAVSAAERIALVADNLRDAPGNLSMAWSFGAQFDPDLKTGVLGAAGRLLTLLLLAAAAAGLLLRLWRGVSAAETFLLAECAGLMLMPHILITTRLFLPLSILLIMYIFVAARALQQRLAWRRPLPQGFAFLLLAGAAAISYAGLLSVPPNRFTADAPPTVAFFDWVKAQTPPRALIVTRNPRALIFYTGRRAVDYHLDQVDPAFLDWQRSLGADDLVLNVDLAEVFAVARAHALPFDDAGLNQALDLYEAAFFGPFRDRFPLAYRNPWFRVYTIRKD